MNKLLVFGMAICVASIGNAQIFDVTSADTVNGTAEGTSNGVGFTFSGSLWNVRTVTDNSFTGFSGVNHVPALATSDVLHTGSDNPTFIFDEVISSALVYLSDNPDGNYTHFFDFGVAAEAVSGNVEVVGTTFRITDFTGGVVRLSGINSNTLASSNIGDGNDFAIVVNPVPEPATLAVLGLGAALIRRKRKS
jgi:hypothetical protein